VALAILTGTALAQTSGQSPERLKVTAQARSSTCYVGQAVDLAVGVVGERERPQVTPPRVEGAELAHLRTELTPLSAGGIGQAVWQKNLYRFWFRLVPRRAGALTVPPFRARLGDRSGASEPLRLTVRATPPQGRPGTFLGGVGPFEVEAVAEPASVRTGQPFEYRVKVTGPAAWGTTSPPGLDRLTRLPLGLRVERRPDETADEPPSHTFVFRLRPTRAGTATLPPVAVAALDSSTGRYVTKVTEGVTVRVVDVPTFDPSALAYGPPPGTTSQAPTASRVLPFVTGAAALAASGLLVVLVRNRRDTGKALRRMTRRLAGRLDRASDDVECARVISEGLADYLRLTTGRPPGALTPEEAEQGVSRATGRLELAHRAAWLIARCDEAQFGPGAGDHPEPLRQAGRSFFQDLAGVLPASRRQRAGIDGALRAW
jgi:hypothetical protein